MGDFQLQTTQQRDQTPANRRPKTEPDLNRNPRKVSKKSLKSAFAAPPEDVSSVLDSLKEFSEASDDNLIPEFAKQGDCMNDSKSVIKCYQRFEHSILKNSPASVHASDTHSLEKVVVSDPTSTPISTLSSVTSTCYKYVASDTANTKRHEVDSLKMETPVEAELVIKRLREARIQVLKSKDFGPSKKILEALVAVTIEECGGLYKECEWHDKLLSSKSNLVFLICIMVIFALLMVWLFNWSSKESFAGLTPT